MTATVSNRTHPLRDCTSRLDDRIGVAYAHRNRDRWRVDAAQAAFGRGPRSRQRAATASISTRRAGEAKPATINIVVVGGKSGRLAPVARMNGSTSAGSVR